MGCPCPPPASVSAQRRGAPVLPPEVKGIIHWLSADHAARVSVDLYDRLFSAASPGAEGEFMDDVNPASLTTLEDVAVRPGAEDFRGLRGSRLLRSGVEHVREGLGYKRNGIPVIANCRYV